MMAAIPRRRRLAAGAALALAAALTFAVLGTTTGCSSGEAAPADRRVIVLGFDGMDHAVTRKLMEEGRLPNFARLADAGGFAPLGTTVPPQSPVAWASFITGKDPGGHGIFDFIHREPETMTPYLSTSRTEASGRTLKIGRWQIPLSGAKVELLRRGEAFWEVLEDEGIPTTIVRMPANFPPSGTATREVTGMGTPDVLGGYGTFTFFTTVPERFADKKISGGRIQGVGLRDNTVATVIYGPENPYLVDPEKLEIPITVHVDPDRPLAKIVVGDEERILGEGEWTDWVPVEFAMIPTQSLRGIVRFHLKRVRPEFELYASPVNFDPVHPDNPISTPSSFAAELAEATGRYYTQGMPEDTKALTHGVFTREEFLSQARIAGQENVAQYRYVLDRYNRGLLFYYFGNLDQISHMLWRPMDPEHPMYDEEADAPFRDVILDLYRDMDDIVGYTLDRIDADTTLIVMSDHGFTSWRRAFHLNTWLVENGYLVLQDPNRREDMGLFSNTVWPLTQAYGLGLNGLYINLQGREPQGSVSPMARSDLMDEIAEKLLEVIDPTTGKPAITKVYRREEIYEDRESIDIGPDLIVGYAKGTRCSNESALGGLTHEVFADNDEEWSGDHCMDHETVPGILLASKKLKKQATALDDLAGVILAEFGIEEFPRRD